VKPLTDDYFHFVSTPHYQEGAAFFLREHRGRIMLILVRLVSLVGCLSRGFMLSSYNIYLACTYTAESMYLSRPGTIPGDVNGLLNYTMSSDYYDNWMVRDESMFDLTLLVYCHCSSLTTWTDHMYCLDKNDCQCTSLEQSPKTTLLKHVKYSKTSSRSEWLQIWQRQYSNTSSYFGWKELPNQSGCEMGDINQATASTPPGRIES
jgi:hypothetical protein